MTAGRAASGPALGELVAGHAFAWLVAGNAVGLLLATVLLVPAIGDWLQPVGYGRWMPLHLDLLLYGWLAMPLLGTLLRAYLPEGGGWRGELALALWSGALLAGATSWLAGHTAGKPFLDWTGGARVAWVGTLALLVAVLADGWRARRRAGEVEGRGALAARLALLTGLAGVPLVFWRVTDPTHYPAVDPASGGPTGGGLLASTLALLAVLLLAPWIAGVPPVEPAAARRELWRALAALALTGLLLATLPGGDRGNDEPLQVLALVALLPWLVLLPRYARRFSWPPEARRWLLALAGWGAVLLPAAVVTFLPPVLRAWKFTDALVAHAHLAMAGLCSAFAALVLASLAKATPLRRALAGRTAFWSWQGGCAVMVVALALAGAAEGADPGLLWRSAGATVTAAYAARWLAGAAMLAASVGWLRGSLAAIGAERSR